MKLLQKFDMQFNLVDKILKLKPKKWYISIFFNMLELEVFFKNPKTLTIYK